MQPSRFILSAVLIMGLSAADQVLANEEEAAFLELVAKQYILAQFPNLPEGVKIEATPGSVNPDKDYGGKCSGYLTAELQGREIRTSNTVKIVCSHPDNPYTVYVPVKIERFIASIAAARDLNKGTLIGPEDIVETYVPDARQNSFGVTDKSTLIGSRLKRDIREGSVFAPESFCVICKGDKVQIEAHKGTLSLKTSGLALEDGNVGDSIKVQNTRSKKTVIGRVASHDTVLIDF